jgi:hypothetical protein
MITTTWLILWMPCPSLAGIPPDTLPPPEPEPEPDAGLLKGPQATARSSRLNNPTLVRTNFFMPSTTAAR